MSSVEQQAASQQLEAEIRSLRSAQSARSAGPSVSAIIGSASVVPTGSAAVAAASRLSQAGSRVSTRLSASQASRKSSAASIAAASAAAASASAATASASASAAASGSVPGRIASDLLELLRANGSSSVAKTLSHRSQSALSAQLLTQIEAAILRSGEPIASNEQDEIEVLGQRGLWLNKQEILNWRGVIPITEYLINEDANPEVITKRSQEKLEYIQELAIRYLRPPTPPAPGEIVIKQEANILTPPAPPLVIRQQPARPETPEPLVVREAPPPAPEPVGRKLVTISGKRLPPPPRKVVIERFAALPTKPQSVLIERWLPYAEVKRRVLFQAAPPDPVIVKPRNVVVQWETPQVEVRKEFKYLGVVRANPAEYVATYGAQLKVPHDLPDFVFEVKTPEGLVLAADYKPAPFHELEGDLHAFKLVNLEQEGLSIYREYLIRLGVLEGAAASLIQASASFSASAAASASVSASASASASAAASISALNDLITQIFATIDRNNNGRINVEDAEKTLLRLNSRLGRRYGEDDVRAFFSALDVNNDGSLDLEEFRKAFLNLSQ